MADAPRKPRTNQTPDAVAVHHGTQTKPTDIMNQSITYPNREAFEAESARRKAITTAPKPKPQVDAVKVTRADVMLAGGIRAHSELVPIWPSRPPKGWITEQEARDLIAAGNTCVAASPEEVTAWLESNEGGIES